MGLFSRFTLKLMGWKIIGALPQVKKYIIIVAPHTSNWDLVIGLLARFAVKTKINFLIKDQAFVFPLGNLLKALGGTPVDRSRKGNHVENVVTLYNSLDEFKLAITPEGTRGAVTRWKEGFYHIANQAGVPVVMVGFDYSAKEIRIKEPFSLTGDINADFPEFISYFRTIKGYYPKEIPDYHPKDQ